MRAEPDHVVKINNISRAHPDTAVTRRMSDVPLFRGAVNVDVPGERIRILRFSSAQPNDSSHNRIASARVHSHDFTGAAAILGPGTARRAISDFICDFQFSERCAESATPITGPELGSGDRIYRH